MATIWQVFGFKQKGLTVTNVSYDVELIGKGCYVRRMWGIREKEASQDIEAEDVAQRDQKTAQAIKPQPSHEINRSTIHSDREVALVQWELNMLLGSLLHLDVVQTRKICASSLTGRGDDDGKVEAFPSMVLTIINGSGGVAPRLVSTKFSMSRTLEYAFASHCSTHIRLLRYALDIVPSTPTLPSKTTQSFS
ncbi:hypothetical protein BDY19DRAFT_1046689 [Irpex rosettiformis]|uniref:Uncharacterized protein n=1 Tax=Irpex rosettiformis TaxID=378272 RepID=A0ACB8UBK7_9APHY|nr:hypothetical protein BDY19DRAFT_1046689 [Irpex rosettiformis]